MSYGETPMSQSNDYVSNADGISASDVGQVAYVNTQAKVYVIDTATGERTPILAAMLDTDSDDAPNVYLYVDQV
jgi:hypothetical protein